MTSPSDDTSTTTSVLRTVRRTPRQAWNDLLSVYYANTPIWRWLKSGALVIGGLFLWAGGNLLLSYRPSWTWLYVVIAYGFLLILWGPLTHFVVVPTVIRLRRTAQGGIGRLLARRGSLLNLSVFLVLVSVLALAAPFTPMVLEFGSFGGDTPDVQSDLECTTDGERIDCVLTGSEQIDHVVVEIGATEETVATEGPPFTFELDAASIPEVRGQQRFVVEPRSEDGELLGRHARTVGSLPDG